MRKNVLASVLAVGGACMMMFNAYGAELTVDEVMANYYEASKEAKSAAADVTMDADISVSVEGMEQAIDAVGHADMSMLFALEPIQYEINAKMNGSAMGMGGDLDMTMYMVDEDGAIVTYSGVTMDEEVQWIRQAIPAEDAQQLYDLIAQSSEMDLSDMPVTYELADEMTEVNGIECYTVTSTITAEDFINLYSYVMEKAGDAIPEEAASTMPTAEDLEMVTSVLAGLKVNLELDIAADTFKPIRMYMDTEGSDWTMIAAVFASMTGMTKEDGTLMSVDLDVKSLFMEAVYDYEAEVAVTVPDEVKEAAQEVDMNELAQELEGVAEMVEDESEMYAEDTTEAF